MFIKEYTPTNSMFEKEVDYIFCNVDDQLKWFHGSISLESRQSKN